MSATYSGPCTLTELFQEQVLKTPSHVALELGDQQLTYAELDQRAQRFAVALHTQFGVGTWAYVALCAERCVQTMVGMLAILKAGAAYVPVDPEQPDEYLRFVLLDAGVSAVVCAASHAERFQRLLQDDERQPRRPEQKLTAGQVAVEEAVLQRSGAVPPGRELPGPHTGLEDALVIYTSGSTGQPKGVILTHRSLCAAADLNARELQLPPRARVLQNGSLCFVLHVGEVWLAYTIGATLVLTSDEERLGSLDELLTRGRISFLRTVPSHLMTSLPHPRSGLWPDLCKVIVAGEPMPRALIKAWKDRGIVRNAYGATEAFCSFFRIVDDAMLSAPKSVGRPTCYTRAYIMSETLTEMPDGETGEVCISSLMLAKGYLNRPQLTEEKFVPNPFFPHKDPFSARLYRTGDMVKKLPNGEYQFEGRSDFMVKLRGQRVELSHIEQRISLLPWVQQCVVVLHNPDAHVQRPGETSARLGHSESYRSQLLAYVVLDKAKEGPSLHRFESAVREHCASGLPAYMVPSRCFCLDRLPLNRNGKTDRQALIVLSQELQVLPHNAVKETRSRRIPHLVSSPDSQVQEPAAAFNTNGADDQPISELERALASLACSTFGVSRVGMRQNLFHAGANSITTVLFLAAVRTRFGITLPLTDFFAQPTLQYVAGYSASKDKLARAPGESWLNVNAFCVFLTVSGLNSLHTFDFNKYGSHLEHIEALNLQPRVLGTVWSALHMAWYQYYTSFLSGHADAHAPAQLQLQPSGKRARFASLLRANAVRARNFVLLLAAACFAKWCLTGTNPFTSHRPAGAFWLYAATTSIRAFHDVVELWLPPTWCKLLVLVAYICGVFPNGDSVEQTLAPWALALTARNLDFLAILITWQYAFFNQWACYCMGWLSLCLESRMRRWTFKFVAWTLVILTLPDWWFEYYPLTEYAVLRRALFLTKVLAQVTAVLSVVPQSVNICSVAGRSAFLSLVIFLIIQDCNGYTIYSATGWISRHITNFVLPFVFHWASVFLGTILCSPLGAIYLLQYLHSCTNVRSLSRNTKWE
eukprot:g61484.t1